MNDKVKNIFKSEYFILIVLTFIALLVRLLNIDKPYGLWNDEILCYSIAAKGLPFGIIHELMKTDFHMPLYYYCLGVWRHFFGDTDVALRLSSVIWGVLAVPAFYYMGKAFKSKYLGYFLAFIACFNPVMIYHSQELRFYSMVVLFSALSITFMLNLVEKPNIKNLIFLGLSNLVILYVYSLGGLFICIQWLVLLIHFLIYKKDYISNYLRYSALFFLFSLPYIILFLLFQYESSQQLIGPFSWGDSANFNIIALLNDCISPFFTEIKDGLDIKRYFLYFQSLKSTIYLVFLCIPTFCFVVGFIFSLINMNKKIVYTSIIAMFVLLAEVALWSQGEFYIVTRYVLIILPIILLLGCNGILLIKNKYFKYGLIILIGIVYFYNVLDYKNMDAFSVRYDGFKYPADTLKSFSTQGDYIISSRYSDSFFMKYLKNYNAIEIETNKMFTIDQTRKLALRVFSKELIDSTNKSNSMYKLAPYFISPDPTNELRNYINSAVAKIPKGKQVIFINGPYGYSSYLDGRNLTIQYLNNEYPENEYKKNIWTIAVNKVGYDIENLLNSNPKLKFERRIEKQTAPDSNVLHQALWIFYVYKKI